MTRRPDFSRTGGVAPEKQQARTDALVIKFAGVELLEADIKFNAGHTKQLKPTNNTMEGQSRVDIVGSEILEFEGLAPRTTLQNILGDNWPNPPLKVDHVSYVYVRNTFEEAEKLAVEYGATFRKEAVRVDGERYTFLSQAHVPRLPLSYTIKSDFFCRFRVARLVYHGDGQHNEFATIPVFVCVLVLQTFPEELATKYNTKGYLHLVYVPTKIHPKPSAGQEDSSPTQPSQQIPFASQSSGSPTQ
jgi:hypothetical protein